LKSADINAIVDDNRLVRARRIGTGKMTLHRLADQYDTADGFPANTRRIIEQFVRVQTNYYARPGLQVARDDKKRSCPFKDGDITALEKLFERMPQPPLIDPSMQHGQPNFLECKDLGFVAFLPICE
jgi:hypothetical protein